MRNLNVNSREMVANSINIPRGDVFAPTELNLSFNGWNEIGVVASGFQATGLQAVSPGQGVKRRRPGLWMSKHQANGLREGAVEMTDLARSVSKGRWLIRKSGWALAYAAG